MQMSDVTDLITVADQYTGYPPTDAVLPYVVTRPLILNALDVALNGDATDWDYQFSVYCCAGSVEACFNLAQAVMGELQGARAGETTLTCTMGYSGAPVEGHYESQVTVQLNQGGL